MRLLPVIMLAALSAFAAPQPLRAQAATTAGSSDSQSDGGGYLTSLLESSLSGAGRQVKVTGFEGALSSQASLRSLTIADDHGIWLTLKGVTLDWSRAALLSGRIKVTSLTADEIDLPRLPQSPPAPATPPSAEAQGFSLPELPVSVSIGKIAAKKVKLGAPVLGQAVTLTVAGSMQLAGGEGAADLSLKRIDGKKGLFTLKASYANETRKLALDLTVAEDAGGILSTLMRLPNAPALDFTVKGAGPLDDFGADIRLATDGQPRLKGRVTLKGSTDDAGATTNHFTADLGGDIAPLFAPDYRDFFGPDITLRLAGTRLPTGQVNLSDLTLAARQLALRGSLQIGADGLPLAIDLTGHLGTQDGSAVLLPLPGPRTTLQSADLSVKFDAAQGAGWQAQVAVHNLKRPEMTLASVTLDGSGKIAHATGAEAASVTGTLAYAARGIAPADARLAQALGDALHGQTAFRWQAGQPLVLPQFSLQGADYGLSGQGQIAGKGGALTVSGKASVTAADLGRFAVLAGRPLGGAAQIMVKGQGQPLAGSFDLVASIDGDGLKVGQPQADALLAGKAQVAASVKRDATGTTIRSLTVNAASLTASAKGVLRTDASDLNATLAFADLGQLGKPFGGALDARVHLTQAKGATRIALTGTGQDLRLGQASADTLLAGRTTLAATITRQGQAVKLSDLTLDNAQLSLKAAPDSAGLLALKARLANLALLVPGLPGPVTVQGTAGQDTVYRLAGDKTGDRPGPDRPLDLTLSGPGGISAHLSGSVAADFATARLGLTGEARAELANPFIAPRAADGPVAFDLRLDGKPALAALSGRISLRGARFAAPLLGVTADHGDITATLSGGHMALSGTLGVGGGQVTLNGPIDLSPPYRGDLSVRLAQVGLKDPQLFSTSVTGAMTIAGPLTGGAAINGNLRLGKTELRVPDAGFGESGAIPDGLRQEGASPAVRATLKRAGLGAAAQRDTSPPRHPFGLDITIAAPSQVFVRGRGLDAELGGTLHLGGTTANIVPSGGFELRRGRLEILTKRFDLTEGNLYLEGRFIPYVHLAASTTNDGVTATVTVDGDASDPTITFSSAPPLPQDEVLAQLLFGHGLNHISPFQAAQLASAVATLAGKGGEGVVSKLRKRFGLDDLDIVTDAQGKTGVKLGKYLTKRIYTDVTVGGDGTTQIDLNLDVTKSVTVRGKAGSDGNTGIGVFYDHDY